MTNALRILLTSTVLSMTACDPAGSAGAIGGAKAKTNSTIEQPQVPPDVATQPGGKVVPGGGEAEEGFRPIWNPPGGNGEAIVPRGDDVTFRPIWNPPGGDGERESKAVWRR